MKTIILTIIVLFVIINLGLTLLQNYKRLSYIKTVYNTSYKNYLIAFGLVIFMVVLILFLSTIVPEWMKWGYSQYFNENKVAGNILVPQTYTTNNLYTVLFLTLLLPLIPFLAEAEEETFRRNKKGFKIFVSGLIFGLVHMIMGIPLFVALGLSVFGVILSFIYNSKIKRYIKNSLLKENLPYITWKGEEIAFNKVVSIHAIYNTILITLTIVFLILS